MVERFMLTGKAPDLPPAVATLKDRWLLLDEVDMFFSSDFYGAEYRPFATVRDEALSDLIKFLWESREDPQKLAVRQVKSSAQYVACEVKFPWWKQLLEGAVMSMLSCLQKSDTHKLDHNYVVINDKIKYFIDGHDEVSDKASYGYSTMFAYLDENENGSIGPQAMERQLAVYMDCGAFSYAEIPKCYMKILGVTGTLEDLAHGQKTLLSNEYQLSKSTYMPSVYGSNQLDFAGNNQAGVMIESTTAGQRMEVIKAIDGCGDRSVIVFFTDQTELANFRASPHFAKYYGCAKVITPETDTDDKNALIGTAATKGNILLCTREFGRGNDFVCYDKQVNDKGGVHVVQTFVSEIKSEERQIMGRTARQGNKGSFCMILNAAELEKFGIGPEDVKMMRSQNNLYSKIDTDRNDYFEDNAKNFSDGVDDIKGAHKQSLEFSNMFHQDDALDKIADVLLEYNPVPPSMDTTRKRTLVLMDATGSMTSLLQKAKNTVSEMFTKANTILEDKGVSDAACEVQFACFRNYSSGPTQLLVASEWASKARTFALSCGQ